MLEVHADNAFAINTSPPSPYRCSTVHSPNRVPSLSTDTE